MQEQLHVFHLQERSSNPYLQWQKSVSTGYVSTHFKTARSLERRMRYGRMRTRASRQTAKPRETRADLSSFLLSRERALRERARRQT